MTTFLPKWWLFAPSVSTPTHTSSSHTPFVRPHWGGPVGTWTSFGYLRATTILTDRISGELIDFILFYHPPGIISARCGGRTNRQPSSLALSQSPLNGRPACTSTVSQHAPPATELISCWTTSTLFLFKDGPGWLITWLLWSLWWGFRRVSIKVHSRDTFDSAFRK